MYGALLPLLGGPIRRGRPSPACRGRCLYGAPVLLSLLILLHLLVQAYIADEHCRPPPSLLCI